MQRVLVKKKKKKKSKEKPKTNKQKSKECESKSCRHMGLVVTLNDVKKQYEPLSFTKKGI